MTQKEYSVAVGQEFGELKVLDLEARTAPTRSRPKGFRAALCQCSCGQQKIVSLSHLATGFVRSCGCGQGNLKHGLARRESCHPLYMTWAAMMERCYNPDDKDYPNWGGRGITVHPEWHDVAAFITWVEANIGPRPEGLTARRRPEYTLDRENNSLGYVPGNLRWANRHQQMINRREFRLSRLGRTTSAERAQAALTLQDTGKTLAEIATILGVNGLTVYRYLHPGQVRRPGDHTPRPRGTAAERAIRAQKVQSLYASGKIQADIAKILGVSQGTVSNDLRSR